MKRFLCLATLLALVMAASMASADVIINLRYSGYTDGVAVNMHTPLGDPNGIIAGQYYVDFENGPQDVRALCVDPATANPSYQPYVLLPITTNAFKAAAWILSKNYGPTDRVEAQIAAWELVWDYEKGNTFNITTATNFYLRPTIPASIDQTLVEKIYNDAIAAVAGGFTAANYRIAHAPPNTTGYEPPQDYIVPVPLPGAVLLLSAGLVRLAAYARRRQED